MLTFVAEIRTKGGSNNSGIGFCVRSKRHFRERANHISESQNSKNRIFRTTLKLKHVNGKERQRCNNSYLQRKRKH